MSKYLDILTNIFKEEADKKASSSSVANVSRATKTITTPIINRTVNNPVRNMGYQKAETKAPTVKNLSALNAIPTVKQNATVKYNGLNTQAQRNEQQAQRTGNTNYLNSYTPSSNANSWTKEDADRLRELTFKTNGWNAPGASMGISISPEVSNAAKNSMSADYKAEMEALEAERKELIAKREKYNPNIIRSFLNGIKPGVGSGITSAINTVDGAISINGNYEAQLAAKLAAAEERRKAKAEGRQSNEAAIYNSVYNQVMSQTDAKNQIAAQRMADRYNDMSAAVTEATTPYATTPETAAAVNKGLTVGNMLPSVVAGYATGVPAIGKGVLFANVYGDKFVEAYERTGDIEKAQMSATASATLEVAIESVSGGIVGLGGGLISGSNIASKITKNILLRAGIERLIDASGEGIEEVASSFLQPIIDGYIYGEGYKMPTAEELWESFKGGALVSLILGLPTDTISAVNNVKAEAVRAKAVNELVSQGISKADATKFVDALIQNNVTAPNSPISATFNEATANSPMFNEVPQNGAQSSNTQLLNNANNGIIKTGGSNNELLLNESRERLNGESARGQIGELAEGAGRTESRNIQAERRASIGDSIRNEGYGEEVKVIGGYYVDNAKLLNQNTINNTPYVAETVKAYADKGVTLIPLAENFTVHRNGRDFVARGVFAGNNLIYASVTDPEATFEELAAHEDFHRIATLAYSDGRSKVVEDISTQMVETLGEEALTERVRAYDAAYDGVYSHNSAIIEELCADVYAGMNIEDVGAYKIKELPQMNGSPKYSVTDGNSSTSYYAQNSGKVNSKEKFSISTAQELAYYKAANNGDTETAQRIVDEAAKAAGYNSPKLYHGTNYFGFTEFDLGRSKDKSTIFTTTSNDMAQTYSGEYGVRQINEKRNAMSAQEIVEELNNNGEPTATIFEFSENNPQKLLDKAKGLFEYYLKADSERLTKNEMPIESISYNGITLKETLNKWLSDPTETNYKALSDCIYKNRLQGFDGMYSALTLAYELTKNNYNNDLVWHNDEMLTPSAIQSEMGKDPDRGNYALFGKTENMLVVDAQGNRWSKIPYNEKASATREIAAEAKEQGFNGVIIKNVVDNGGYGDATDAGDIYIYFNSNKLKSADPITYDDNGNVIPLSKRFSDSEDIRFSLTEEEAEGLTLAQQQVRDMMFNDYIYPDYNVSNRTDAPEEAIRFKSQYARDLYDTLIKDFGVQKGRRSVNKAIAEYASKYIEGKATQADTDTLFNVLYENGTESEYDNYKAAINDSIKGKKYYAPDHVRKELSYLYDTYKNFKDQSMGKFYLTGNATALRIDVAYQELQNTYGKLYFPDENHEAEMLANILKAYDETTMKPKSLSEVAENEAWEGVSFEESEARYKGILEATLNDFKQKAFKERVSEPSVDTRDILQMYQEVKSLKAAAETAEGAWKLSKTDNIIVDEMLRGAYDNVRKSGIRPDNAEGVQAVYEAKKVLKDTQAAIKRHQNAHKAALFDWANNLIKNSDAWKEKSAGLGYNTETAERNMRDIIGDNAEAKRVISEVFTPVHENEAEATRMKKDIRKKVKELGLSEKGEYVVMIGERSYKLSEAGLVQAYGEGLISDSRLKATGADFDKITNAVKVFRGIYEQLFEKQNEVLVRNGYPPVEHRADYFPHFTEDVPETFFKKILAKMGISIRSDMLPTDIAGLTDTFRPGKAWAGYMQQRKGDVTSYNALKGLDNYIETAGDVLYHTDDIQRVRALESALRYKYSDKGTQEAINEVRANDTLTEEQRQGALDELYKRDRTAFPNLVTWFREYGDNLANKKSSDDRGWERNIGRGIYNTVGAVEKRLAGNMVVGNISSALTNFIPLTQGWAEIKTPKMLYGLYDTIRSYVKNDGLAEESTFLTNRRGSDKLSKTGLEKTSDTLMFLMNGIDDLVSNTLVRSRYYQNVKGGMDSTQAMKEADSWAASVMADRSKGSMPLIFNNKNPLVKFGTMFQLEANNQLRYAFKDIPRGDKGPKQIALALFKMFLGAFLYNELYEKLAGRRPALDPFGMIKQLIEDWKSDGVGAAGEGLFTNVVEEIPFVGGLVGGGRIPVSSALPDAGNIWRALTDKDGVDAEAIGKELMNPLFYFMFPVGGSQLKKTIQGISTVAQGGEKNASGGLKFDVEPTAGNYIQAGLFGKWALPEAQEYIDRGFTAMYGKARTEAREEAIEGGMSAETFDGYFNTLTGDTQIDALYALSKLNLSDEEKETLWSATSDWSKSYKEFYEENAGIINSEVSVDKYNELKEAFKDLKSEDKKYKLYQDATLTGDQKNALGKALEMGDIDFSSYESFILSDYTDKQRYMWDYVSSKGLKLEQYTRALDTYYKDGTPSKAVGIKRLTDAGFTSAWANWFYNNVVNNKEGTGGAETPEKKDYIVNQLAQKGYDEAYYDKAYEAYKKYGPKEVRIKRIVDAGYSQAWAEWFYAQMQKNVGVNKNGEYYLY